MKDIIVFTQILVIGLIPLATSFVLYMLNLTIEDKTLDTLNSFVTMASIFYIFLLPLTVLFGLVYIGSIYKNSGINHPYSLILFGIVLFAITFVPAYYLFSTHERDMNQNLTYSKAFISYPIHGIALIPYLYSTYLITNKLIKK